MSFFIQGFLFSIAYLAPIGMQNLYVINTAAVRGGRRAYAVALITAFFDISLVLACFYGMGMIMDNSVVLRAVILAVGSLVLIYIGFQLFSSSPETDSAAAPDTQISVGRVVAACFSITWLNPQALIDGSLLLGGIRASLSFGTETFFVLGSCLASVCWFMFIAVTVSKFRNFFDTKVLKTVNVLCGTFLILYGIKLGYDFIAMFNLVPVV